MNQRRVVSGITAVLIILSAVACQERPSAPGPEKPGAGSAATPVAPVGTPGRAGIKLVPGSAAAESAHVSMGMWGETGYRPAGSGATPAIPITGRIMEIPLDGAKVRGYAVQPSGAAPLSRLLMIHEWWGLTRDVTSAADRFARAGYRVLAIDLFGGATPADRTAAVKQVQSVDSRQAVATLKAALDWLTGSDPNVAVGVVGYGYGATLALQLALEDGRPKALVLEYPDLTVNMENLTRIKTPLLGIFAMGDGMTTLNMITEFRREVSVAGVQTRAYIYQQPPGFSLHPENDAQRADAEKARKEVLEFLRERLPQGTTAS
ncbi:MAG: dienelactone hydrolase family protein [bacterium]|nr:dienelactone hydrolase family protein [bacterium]